MTNTLENLYIEFTTIDNHQSDSIVDLYEKNSIYFNNIKQLRYKEEVSQYIFIVGKYIMAIFNKDRYNQTIDLVDKHLEFIDNEIQRLNVDEVKNTWYNSLFYYKGVASYNLKDYKTATLTFKKLRLLDGENDNYKNWLSYSVYGQRIWLSRTINIISIGLILTKLFFGKYITSFIVKMSLDGLGLLGLLFTFGYEYYIKSSFRKKKESRTV